MSAVTMDFVLPVVRDAVTLIPVRPTRSVPAWEAAPMVHDAESFDVEAAFRDHGAALFGFAVNTTRDHGAAEECVQETFVRAWRSRDRYERARGSERTWLFAIARNVVTDHLRARARRPRLVTEEALTDHADHVSEGDAAADRMTLIEALSDLSDEHRDVIVAVKIEGLSYHELSDRIGVPVPTLRTRMYHGLRALRATLTEEGPHD